MSALRTWLRRERQRANVAALSNAPWPLPEPSPPTSDVWLPIEIPDGGGLARLAEHIDRLHTEIREKILGWR